jgi:hypothetical protein
MRLLLAIGVACLVSAPCWAALEVLTPMETSQIGGTDCYIGTCMTAMLNPSCDKALSVCSEYTTEASCLAAVTGKNNIYVCAFVYQGTKECWWISWTNCTEKGCEWYDGSCKLMADPPWTKSDHEKCI